MAFKAVRVTKTDAGQSVAFAEVEEADLMDGDVTVRVTHSTVNYKDGLALSGKVRDPAQVSAAARHRLRRHRRNLQPSGLQDRRRGDRQRFRPRRDPFRRLFAQGARQGRLAGQTAGAVQPRRGDGDWHRGLYGGAGCGGADRGGRHASDGSGRRDGRGRRRRLHRHRAARRRRLERHRLDRTRFGGRLSHAPRRRGDHRPRDAFRAGQSAGQGALDRRRRQRRLATRWRTCCRRRNIAAPSPLADWRAAWTCRVPSRRSSCAACG